MRKSGFNIIRYLLQRFLHFSNEVGQPITLPIVKQSNNSESTIRKNDVEIPPPRSIDFEDLKRQTVQALPKLKRNVGELLYDTLLKSNNVSWDQTGRVSVNGRELIGSSITDLISDVVRDRKTSNPQGWTIFAEALGDLNIPHEYIQNTRRRAFIAARQRQPSTPQSKTLRQQRKKQDQLFGSPTWKKWEKYHW